MNFKAIFWDNDGVLVDTEKLYMQANCETFAAEGIELSLVDYCEYYLKQNCGAWFLLRERGDSEDKISRLHAERDARYSELLGQSEYYINGIENVLRELHESFYMALVTSCPREHFNIIHRSGKLLPYFELILTREAYKKSKPDAEPYLLALEKSGFEASEVLVIEDSQRGLEAARAAGLECWIVETELQVGMEFSPDQRKLGSIQEILNLL